MRALGATTIDAELGPCLHVECCEFGASDLASVAERYGPTVRGRASNGQPALDLVAGVKAAARAADVDLWVSTIDVGEDCTSCNGGKWFSHRARADTGRMATVIWREDGPGAAR